MKYPNIRLGNSQTTTRGASQTQIEGAELRHPGATSETFQHKLRQVLALTLIWSLVLSPMGWADRTQLKPGWNMFSPQQDVDVGQQTSREAERQLPILNDARANNYLNNLGRQLSSRAPGYQYPYRFKVVNEKAINAFALPGGYVYINRGVLEAADNEAQLAGVIAHEISHVALRHGTNQASKSTVAQMPLAILGGILGNNSTGAALAQLGVGFTVNSILLKYSRDAESQADIMGTQILYDSGYDPRAMGQFFQKIQTEGAGGRPIEFFSNHPNPDNRMARVNEEVNRLGGPPNGFRSDSRQFQDIKRYVQSLPVANRNQMQSDNGRTGTARRDPIPDWPSDRFVSFANSLLQFDYPDNWQAYGQGDAVTIAPRGGLVNDGRGNQALAYGAMINLFEPRGSRYSQQFRPRGYGQGAAGVSLEEATDQLIEQFRQSNRSMRLVRSYDSLNVNGERALSTYLSHNSPIGGRETNWLVTFEHPDGLLFIVFTAPERDFQNYERTFEQMVYSVRINR